MCKRDWTSTARKNRVEGDVENMKVIPAAKISSYMYVQKCAELSWKS
jgi:hypothetical protein